MFTGTGRNIVSNCYQPQFIRQFSLNRDRWIVSHWRNSKHYLRSIVCCSVSATRFLTAYKCIINVYVNWEKYCLKLLPTTVYTSIFVKSRSQNRLSVKKFQTFSFLRNFYFMWAKYCEKVRATTFSGKSRSRNRLHICTCAYLHVCIFARLHIFIQMKKF